MIREANSVEAKIGKESLNTTLVLQQNNISPKPTMQLGTVLKKRWGVIALVAIALTGASALGTYQQQPVYYGSFKLLVKSSSNSPTETTSGTSVVTELPEASQISPQTQVEVLQSPKILNPILENLTKKHPEIDAQNLIKTVNLPQSPLNVSRVGQTQVLEVSYQDSDPEKIKLVLNQLSEAYTKYGLETQQSQLKQGLEFVKTQLPTLQKRVKESQDKLQQFRQKYNLIDPAQEAQQLSQQLALLETENFETRVRLQESLALYENLKKELNTTPKEALVSNALSESPRYQSLLNQLQQIDVEMAQQSTDFLPDSPVLQNLKEKRANLIKIIQQEAKNLLGDNGAANINKSLVSPSNLRLNLQQKFIQASYDKDVLKIRRSYLEERIKTVKADSQKLSALTRQYADLQQQVQVNNESLSRFLDAQESLQIQAAQNILPWQIISPTTISESAIYPYTNRNLGLGLGAGLILGLGAAFLVESLSQRFEKTI